MFPIARALFAAAALSAAASAQINLLTPGRLSTAVLPEVQEPTLFNGSQGFVLDVPDDAARLEIRISSAPADPDVDLFLRFGSDVVMEADGSVTADYESATVGGAESIVVTPESFPPLRAGRHFAALRSGFGNLRAFVFIEAIVGAASDPSGLVVLASDDFEDGRVGDWTRNFPEPEIETPGATQGNPDSQLVAARPAGGPADMLTRHLRLDAGSGDAFVAPGKYLGMLSLLGPLGQLEFELAAVGAGLVQRPVEVRLIGALTTYAWTGDRPTNRLRRFSAPLDPSSWRRLSGSASFQDVIDNVLRIEIFAEFGLDPDAATLLDNVALLGRVGAPSPTAASDFESGQDGWTGNVAEAPFLTPRVAGVTSGDFRTSRDGIGTFSNGGNPDGWLQVRDFTDLERDYLVAPRRFLGDLSRLGPGARIEFDRRHASDTSATRGVEVRLIGFDGAFLWTGELPDRTWRRFSVPLIAEPWSRIGGAASFAEVLRAVQRIEVSMDEVTGPEEAGLDNFRFVAPDGSAPALSAAPESLGFAATQGDPAPTAAIDFASSGPTLEWVAAPTADAPWLSIEPNRGATPASPVVRVDPAGLSPGSRRGEIEIAWAGSSAVLRVPVVFNLASISGPLISVGGAVNAATFTANSEPGGELTGGQFAAIFGSRLASRQAMAQALPLPTELDGARVTIGGVPAPLVFVSPTQINAVVPRAVLQSNGGQPVTSAEVIVIRNGEAAPPERIRLTPAPRPVLFSRNSMGSGPGAIQNVDGAERPINSADSPARPGQFVTLFGSGFGPVQNPLPDGEAATGLNRIVGVIRVLIGGLEATASFAGLTPGLANLYQVDVPVPGAAPSGCEVPVKVFIDGVESNEVTMAITPDGAPCR